MKILIAIIVIIIVWSLVGYFTSNVEQAEYKVIRKTENYEVRNYPKHIVAQTKVSGQLTQAMNSGFSIVAEYIFGGNVKKEKIAMTAPVIVKDGDSQKIPMTAPVVSRADGSDQIISFGMPKSYTLESLPSPINPKVQIVEIPEQNLAVASFSWFTNDKRIKKVQEKLLNDLAKDGPVRAFAAAIPAR
jgi:hypothetical protein